MRTLLQALAFISPPFLKPWLLRLSGATVGRKVRLGWLTAVMGRELYLGDHARIEALTIIKINGVFQLGAYSKISSFTLIYGSSDLKIGRQSYIGPQCLLNIDEPVFIGSESALGPRCQLFTHGSFFPYTEGYWVKRAGVTVADRVWCAAGVFLHPGVEIGTDTFVNSRAVVSGDIPAGSIVEGNPAKVIYPMDRLKRRMSPRRTDAALVHILKEFAEVVLGRRWGLSVAPEKDGRLLFDYRGRSYAVMLIPAAGDLPSLPTAKKLILLINRPDYVPPAGVLVFDMATKTAPFGVDKVHTALRQFMQRYFGVRFGELLPPKS